MDINKQDDCEHKFVPLGFEVYKKTDQSIEAVAAALCEKCSMFRTKILKFRLEF